MYERAVANAPPVLDKKYWKRYIYLWINYAIFEETQSLDLEKAKQVYDRAIKLVPHQ